VWDGGESLDDMSAIYAATYCRLKICDTAECNSALQGNPQMSTHPGIQPDSMGRIRYSTENSEEPFFLAGVTKNG
jgi:hypothetical protein